MTDIFTFSPPSPPPLPSPPAEALQARLSPAGSSSGRLELSYNNGDWGTVCSRQWTLTDSDVACRMIGFNSAISMGGASRYGQGVGDILLDNVTCYGNERTLLDCPHSAFNSVVQDCRHEDDVGINCTS